MTLSIPANLHDISAPVPLIRHLLPADLPAVLSIQQACYPPSMNESAATIQKRLKCAPTLGWIAFLGDAPAAYLMTYPSMLGKVTPLGGDFDIPDDPDCLYFHDLAVKPTASGNGLGAALVRHALASSRWPVAALVCVQGARRFWMRQGFADFQTREALQAGHLATYPGQACYMVRRSG